MPALMVEPHLRRRARMRAKDAKRFIDALDASFGIGAALPESVEKADAGDRAVLVADGRVLAFIFDDEQVIPTCHLLMKARPAKAFVTVDMGAVRFVNNGADTMAPGITDADEAIQVGDFVWIRDEKNGVPLGVGEAMMTGPQMAAERKGKAVKAMHHVGDDWWNLEV